ncbi:hypothetical protein Taro_050987, partial [Colocasia esculenta]|nr:hypothetical protein [Colocasia esculenta]
MASHVTFRSRRRAASRSQLLCVFKEPQPNRAWRSSARPREAAARVSWRFEVLVEFLACSRPEDVVRSGGKAWSSCSSRSGNPWSSSRIRVCACEGDRPCRRDKVATGRPIAIGFLIAT